MAFDFTILNDNDSPTEQSVYWAGAHAPLPSCTVSSRILSPEGDFREEASQHGTHTAVCLVEPDLGQYKQWPLILDEALRLFRYGERGLLLIRFQKSTLMSQFAFAAFLQKRRDVSFELVAQDKDEEGALYYTLYCTRASEKPSLSTFEFALITDGRRPNQVQQFIESVLAIQNLHTLDWSIAICGPQSVEPHLSPCDGRLRFIEQSDKHAAKGWITHKKNLIVETSSAENLLIAHDRYAIPPMFIEQMRRFGADFSVIAPAQTDLSNRRFPDWMATNSQWLCTVSAQLQYGDYSPHLYVNGGIIISKRQVLLETPWNNLLFWDQCEDIELTRRMTDAGITPRLARQVAVTVIDSRPGFLYDFVSRLPFYPHHYVVAHGGLEPSQVASGAFEVGEVLNLSQQNGEKLAQKGLVAAHTDWSFDAHGLVSLHRTAELAIDVGMSLNGPLYLSLQGTGALDKITVNGQPLTALPCNKKDKEPWHMKVNIAPLLSPNARFIVLSIVAVEQVSIMAIGLLQSDSTVQYPLRQSSKNDSLCALLRHGWAMPEPWGIWSIGPEATLHLPIPEGTKGDLLVRLTLIAYSAKKFERKWVGVACGSVPLKLLKVPAYRRARFKIRIPRALIQDTRVLKLSLLPACPTSPKTYGISSDDRLLGVGLIAVDAKSKRTLLCI